VGNAVKAFASEKCNSGSSVPLLIWNDDGKLRVHRGGLQNWVLNVKPDISFVSIESLADETIT